MKHPTSQQKILIIGGSIIAIIFVALGSYTYVRLNELSTRIDALAGDTKTLATAIASSTAFLQSSINQDHTFLNNEISAQRQNVGVIQQQLGGFQSQVGTISGTVSTLQKLAQTDPQLLEKYSKVYFLNENYVPARLSEIPLSYQYSENKQLLFQGDALPHLLAMIDAASSTVNVKLYVESAYRSFAEQKALKGDYAMTYGAGTANSFSADQGYSEHQLGTAVDMLTPGLGGNLDDSFAGTAAFQWMQMNAYRYGFILSYPKDNGYYVYEPWHWRFVGVKLATDLHNQGKNFYDLDQRTIDTYLVNIFD